MTEFMAKVGRIKRKVHDQSHTSSLLHTDTSMQRKSRYIRKGPMKETSTVQCPYALQSFCETGLSSDNINSVIQICARVESASVVDA